MRPLPWWVPLVSPSPFVSDAQLADGLTEALGCLPAGAPSLFMGMLSQHGRPTSLAHAARWADAVSTPAYVVTSAAYLLTWAPLHMDPRAARSVVEKRHGPRHILPEIARVALLPHTIRQELGYWIGGGGRMSSMQNRYSRDGERVLQRRLRALLFRHVAERLQAAGTPLGAAVPIEFFRCVC